MPLSGIGIHSRINPLYSLSTRPGKPSSCLTLFLPSPPPIFSHLSARLCPIHREKVIQTAKQKLEQGKNIILIATRVIEAGIDISFPTVYRACAGIDSIAQAAGRCNRHGEREGKGLVFVYESTDFPLPDILDDLRASASATREILAQEPEAALLSPEISNRFFRIYYNNRKNQTNLWDSKNIREMALLNPVSEKVFKSLRFKDINKSFKMIPDASHSVMITIESGGLPHQGTSEDSGFPRTLPQQKPAA